MYRTPLPILALPLFAAACNSMSSTDTQTPSEPTTPTVSAKPKETAPARALPYPVHRAKLDNGLTVITVPMPSDGLVSYWSVVRTGSRDEVEEGVTGFAHFFEHMMFRGTERYPGKEYDKIVNGMGADANAFTTDDFTAYHMSFSKEDLAKAVEIEADRFQNLKYPEQLFTTEAGAVMGEYRKGRMNPFQVLFEAIQDTAFEKHTYKHTTIGFLADIERMPKQFEYSKSFFQRFYRPENVVVLVTGDVDPARVVELAKKEYGGWKKGYQAPAVPAEPPQTKQKRVDVPYEGDTLPILTLNFKGDRPRP
jgi:zinc protease